jgi:hypothetical protein
MVLEIVDLLGIRDEWVKKVRNGDLSYGMRLCSSYIGLLDFHFSFILLSSDPIYDECYQFRSSNDIFLNDPEELYE